MSLPPDDPHAAVRDSVRAFVRRELLPHVDAWEEAGAFPRELYRKAGAAGILGIGYPEAFGGSFEGDLLAKVAASEELMRCGSGGLVAGLGSLDIALPPVLRHARPALRDRLVPAAIAGEAVMALGVTEPGGGSDVARIQTRAVRDGDVYRVTGAKTFITSGCRADAITLAVRTGGEGHAGISLLVVEKPPGDRFDPPHLTGQHIRTAGFHGLPSYSLFFDGLRVPASHLVGLQEGQGVYQLMFGYERARVLIGFRCIGIAQAAYDAAFRHTQERVQFGKPIAEFQAVRHKLADMATQLTAARAFAHRVARTLDSGQRCNTEAGMVKLFCSEMAAKVTHTAMLLHGGTGYAAATDVNRYWRDGVLMSIGEGTSDIQRDIIAKGLLNGR